MATHHTANALQRVQAARAGLILDHPFFGVLALNLLLQQDDAAPTAWTDGRSLGFNPAFVATLSDAELTAVIAHEVMHCASGHCWRRDSRDHKRFNVAADYAINAIIAEAGLTLPACALQDSAYAGQSAEWIYDRLPADDSGDDDSGDGTSGDGTSGADSDAGASGDPGGAGEVRDAPAGADAPTAGDWQQHVQSALAAAAGQLPGSLQRAIDKASRAAVDWRALLRRFVQDVAASDYTWARPSARYMAAGLYLPSLREPALGRITIAVDTSGSIDVTLLQQFSSEIAELARELSPASVQVIYCDSRVHRVDTFERGDAVTMTAVGGGGTAFGPVFAHVDSDGEVPAVLVYLTDLDGSFPDAAPSYPVLWASYGRAQRAPFGDVIDCRG